MNENEMRVVGMSRSGNHPILQWIMDQAAGRIVFLNCAEPKTNPFATARPLSDGARARASYPGFELDREACGELTPKNWLLYNYEDTFLGKVVSPSFEESRSRWVGRSRRRIDLLIIRDPFNLFASRRRAGFFRGSDCAPPGMVSEAVARRIWKQHAREALGRRAHLGGDERIIVRYNSWARSHAYRRELAGRIGLDFDDRTARLVPGTAGGSSFDGIRAHGAAHEMAVTERWRHYRADHGFWALFDETVLELSEALFGRIPGTRAHVLSTVRPTGATRSPGGGSYGRKSHPAP